MRAQIGHVDVFAERGEQTLTAEVKGRTAAIGLDADTARAAAAPHDQKPTRTLVRRRRPQPDALQATLRVPTDVRDTLHIDVYEVTDAGDVHQW